MSPHIKHLNNQTKSRQNNMHPCHIHSDVQHFSTWGFKWKSYCFKHASNTLAQVFSSTLIILLHSVVRHFLQSSDGHGLSGVVVWWIQAQSWACLRDWRHAAVEGAFSQLHYTCRNSSTYKWVLNSKSASQIHRKGLPFINTRRNNNNASIWRSLSDQLSFLSV